MADVLAPLEELPATTAALMSATLRAGRNLTVQSAERLAQRAGGPADTLWAIRKTSLDLRFLVARQGEEVFFFFFKRQLPQVRPLMARLQACVQATEEVAPIGSLGGGAQPLKGLPQQPIYRLKVPSFLFVNPTAAELSQYAPPGTTAQNGVLFRVGKTGRSILGICRPELGIKAKVSYQVDGEAPRLLTNWPVEPFLALIETLRDFIAGEQTNSTELDLELPTDPSQMSDVHVTLYWFVEAFRAMEDAQRVIPPVESSSASAALIRPSYGTTSYSAEIALSVDSNGRFASAKSQDLISLGMHLSVLREKGALLARIALDPPDFLCQGALRDAFLESLRQSAPKELRKALGFGEDSAWSDFLDSAKERSVVFRIARDGNTDQDAVVLPGTVAGTFRTVILRTQAVVDASGPSPRVALSKTVRMYDSAAGQAQTLDVETVTYFMRLASALQSWLRVI